MKHLFSLVDRFAPGFGAGVAEYHALHPRNVEQHFGIAQGHIHHVENTFAFGDRLPYVTPVAGLYSCSAGCHPAGAAIGAAGHNSAVRVLRDMELGLEATLAQKGDIALEDTNPKT